MEKTQTPVKIDWVAEENPADYNFVNTSLGIVLVLCMDGRYLTIGAASCETVLSPEKPWLFWTNTYVDEIFDAAQYRPYRPQHCKLTFEEVKQEVEAFVWFNLWKFAPLMKDFGHKEKAGLS